MISYLHCVGASAIGYILWLFSVVFTSWRVSWRVREFGSTKLPKSEKYETCMNIQPGPRQKIHSNRIKLSSSTFTDLVDNQRNTKKTHHNYFAGFINLITSWLAYSLTFYQNTSKVNVRSDKTYFPTFQCFGGGVDFRRQGCNMCQPESLWLCEQHMPDVLVCSSAWLHVCN